MKRLLRGKKQHDDSSDAVSPTTATSPTVDFPPSKNLPAPPKRRWGKKKQEEVKPELDLTIALPSSDNFRTSLIMPGLSNRFSMLREQDDPSSILGKASDDSVLPRRSSRMLEDIAEVSSLSPPLRPPYADSERKPSYFSDGYATDDDSSRSFATAQNSGSIMSRARPGEGNVLFGGRQKIYKIPIGDAGAVNSLGSGQSRGMRGRALYEDDVSMSAFQRLRAKEREAERQRKLSEEQDRDPSRTPSLVTYDEKRNTSSSTNSGPSTLSASTAPTSLASPGGHMTVSSSGFSSNPASPNPSIGMERSKFGSVRKLYETKLDQHMQEQQTSNIKRLSSLQRRSSGRAASPQLLQTGNFQNQQSSLSEPTTAGSGTASSLPPSEGLTTFESIRQTQNANGSVGPTQYVTSTQKGSPLSSPTSAAPMDPLTQALDAKDRGKATALGAFNRPKQPFDEQQYMQRQRSLAQQRATPPGGTPRGVSRTSSRHRAPSASREREPSIGHGSQPGSARPSVDQSRPSLDTRFRRPTITNRADRSWSASSGPGKSASPMSSTQSPAKAGHCELGMSRSPQSHAPQSEISSSLNKHDDREVEHLRVEAHGQGPKLSFERGRPEDAPQPLRSPPSLMEHPAMRVDNKKSETSLRAKRSAWNPDLKLADFKTVDTPIDDGSEHSSDQNEEKHSEPEAQPTGLGLDPSTAEGLTRNMVRTHLRNISEVSSVYPNTPKQNAFDFPEVDLDVPVPSMYSENFDIWKATNTAPPQAADDRRNTHRSNDKVLGDSPTVPHFTAQGLEAPDRDDSGDSPTVPNFSPRSLRVPGQVTDDMPEWEKEMHAHHARAGSATTQAEREAFADELALRQKTIRENLRMKTDLKNRSPSPSALGRAKKQFGILRNVSSHETLGVEDVKAKLGSFKNTSSTSIDRDPSQKSRNSPRDSLAPTGRTLHSRLPPRDDASQTSRGGRARQNSTESGSQHSRERTGSDASYERSRSRPRAPSIDHSRRNRLDTRVKQVRSPVDTPQTEHTKPSFDSYRVNSNSSSERPSMASTDRSGVSALNTSATRAESGSSPTDTASIAPSWSGTYSSLRGETNTSLAQTPMGRPSKETESSHNPASTFMFPARKNTQSRPAHRFAQHVQKSDISEPTLISATSNVDVVDLPEGASLSNGMASDVDAVLAAQQAALADVDMMHPSNFSGPSDRGSSATMTTNSISDAGRKSPPIGGISIEKGQPPASPPPLPSVPGKRGLGFMKAFSRREENDGVEDLDDFVVRPPGGRLRIRKVSDESLGGRHRHQVVGAGEVEGGMI